ncbi:uncharacterized protein BBA_08675 [Beauveria bassiana ARSEF 2860]|uniref:Uncharacterized protein n=1 Tax=Beauveria bassiana (strain ARSEF 2860) TaxID=655819 RepID=J4KLK2_BEAB2|nr:uncharacterized protein BBA_08675 [Beauveria bassiana ARSEF 2860]EJP62349.1 hypothetical protein BBA_08675 [Beauveria bassiana ARSEF 2860]
MQTAPEENRIHGISMRVEPAAGEAFAEQQQRARVTGLESTVAARVLDSAAKEKELQEKFDKFKQLEVEQVIQLEHLATVEQENRGRIDELKRSAADPGLEAMERDKRSVVRQLEEEERRLRSMVDDFTAKVRALSAEEQAKANSAAAIEQQQRSTVEKLTNKELRRASHEGGRSATTEQAAEADVQEETNGGPGLEDMIRDALGPEEDHPTQAEDVPLPLFSRGIPAAEGEMEASAEV